MATTRFSWDNISQKASKIAAENAAQESARQVVEAECIKRIQSEISALILRAISNRIRIGDTVKISLRLGVQTPGYHYGQDDVHGRLLLYVTLVTGSGVEKVEEFSLSQHYKEIHIGDSNNVFGRLWPEDVTVTIPTASLFPDGRDEVEITL